jgi:hypothetical protein
VCRLRVEALVVHLAGRHLLVRDLLLSAMRTDLHAVVALQHKLKVKRPRSLKFLKYYLCHHSSLSYM